MSQLLSLNPSARKYITLREPTTLGQDIVDVGTWALVPLVRGVMQIYDYIQRRNLPSIIAANTTCIDGVAFPRGNPDIGTVYVVHPHMDTFYLPYAQFHQYLFESRIAELVNLLFHAGAISVVLEATDTKTKNTAIDAKAKFLDSEAVFDIKSSKDMATSIVWTVSSEGKADRILPPRLIWFSHEPTWQTMWDSVINSGVKSFEMRISHSNNFGVTATLGMQIEQYGRLNLQGKFTLGGQFEDVTNSNILIKATFP